jgi:hypothetical protein
MRSDRLALYVRRKEDENVRKRKKNYRRTKSGWMKVGHGAELEGARRVNERDG